MKYNNIVKAKFVSRPNRFVANVEIDGINYVCHVKNTGRCKELLIPGCTVYLEDFESHMGTRKLRFDLISVEKKTNSGKLLINMDSQAPNKVAKEAFEQGLINIPGLEQYGLIKPETTFGNSRFDFYLEDVNARKAFVEVKGCTLEEAGVCSFPDAPTERGVKHVEELIEAKKSGYEACLLFIVQMEGMEYLHPNDATHRAFGDALRKAQQSGVNILAYECKVTKNSLNVTKSIPVKTIY